MPDLNRLDLRKFTLEQLLLTPVEAAAMLSISRTTIYALMKTGDIAPVHIGRSCRISVAEVLRYVASRDVATNAAFLADTSDNN